MGTVVSQHELDGLFLDTPCLGYLSSKLDADPKNIDAILRDACNSIRGIGNRTERQPLVLEARATKKVAGRFGTSGALEKEIWKMPTVIMEDFVKHSGATCSRGTNNAPIRFLETPVACT